MRFIKRTTRKSIAPKSLEMDAAKKLLDISAEKNRNLLFFFMAYLAIATVLVLSITDLDLLLDQKNIQLPLLSVGLPMWAFYTVIPFLLVLLHFNVLQNVQEHNKKREAWLAHKPIDPGTQLFPYLLDFAKVRYGLDATPNVASKLVAAGTWVIYVYLPLLVLAVFFIRFADLQGIATSSWHLALGVIDIYFLSQFWQRLRSPDQSFWQRLRNPNQSPVRLAKWLLRSVTLILFRSVALGLLAFSVLWTLTLFSYIQLLHFDSSYSQNPIKDAIALEDQLQQIDSIAIVPRISAPNARPYQVKDDDIRLDKWLNPNKKNSELWQSSPRPLDWGGKRLAFADLKNSQLQRVNLLGADLQGAKLLQAQLQGADLNHTQLQGADLDYAELQGAELGHAQLQGANLNYTQLQGASLFNAYLQGTYFFNAQLQSADLGYAQLQGSYLKHTNLQGAILQKAQMQGADLSYAQLQGSFITSAKLQGANLENAHLQGADLSHTQILGINWQGSNTKGMLVLGLDRNTRFDFANYTDKYSINNEFAERMNKAARRQDAPLPVPIPFGTKNPSLYKKIWLSLLCQGHYSHKGMLQYYWLTPKERRLIPAQATRAYVEQTPHCESYRAMTSKNVPLIGLGVTTLKYP